MERDREAAEGRAARFVDDYELDCAERKRASIVVDDPTSDYVLRVIQRRTPGPHEVCRDHATPAEAWKCDEQLACGSDAWEQALDWSQWHPGATVLELAGVPPERINVAHTHVGEIPVLFDYSSPWIELYPFYQSQLADEVPPGCHNCGYWWYLDPTPNGVALVLSPAMAQHVEPYLSAYHLDLCLVE